MERQEVGGKGGGGWEAVPRVLEMKDHKLGRKICGQRAVWSWALQESQEDEEATGEQKGATRAEHGGLSAC